MNEVLETIVYIIIIFYMAIAIAVAGAHFRNWIKFRRSLVEVSLTMKDGSTKVFLFDAETARALERVQTKTKQ